MVKLSNILPAILRRKLNNSNKRTIYILKNSIYSLIAKIISIFCSLAIIPLTINYVNPTQYGIWLTLSSMIGWVHFFDLGLSNGFRNKFAEAKAIGNITIARSYLTTTYFATAIIMSVVLIFMISANLFIDWASVLNVNKDYNEELSRVFILVAVLLSINMCVNILGTLYSADQKNGIASLINALGQLFSLIIIIILTKTTEGNLTNLALYLAGVPCFTWIIASIYAFNFSAYKKYKPSFSLFKLKYIKDIMGLGGQFFIINLCLIVVFQLVNVVISRELGPSMVTEYNIASKYFNVIYMLVVILITPMWSAFTDAYTLKDYSWMINTIKKLDVFFILICMSSLLMFLVSPYVYRLWLGDGMNVSFEVTLISVICMICQSYSTIYMYLINGIGYIRIQLLIYLFFVVITWPAMIYLSKLLGIVGIISIPSIVYLTQGIIAKIQLTKIMSKRASGIWIK